MGWVPVWETSIEVGYKEGTSVWARFDYFGCVDNFGMDESLWLLWF